jgi:hypothetical protein
MREHPRRHRVRDNHRVPLQYLADGLRVEMSLVLMGDQDQIGMVNRRAFVV